MTSPELHLPELRLHTFAEVAVKLKTTLRVLRDRAYRREFDHVKIGRERYLTDDQLTALIQAHTVKSVRADALAPTRARVARQRARRSRQ